MLLYALYSLAENEKIQMKARNEIDRVLAKYNGDINYEAIGEMQYLERIVHGKSALLEMRNQDWILSTILLMVFTESLRFVSTPHWGLLPSPNRGVINYSAISESEGSKSMCPTDTSFS